MLVITADQIGSRRDVDRAADAARRLTERHGGALALPVDQTAGDEIQALTADAGVALDLVLDLARDGHWSIGLGIGAVRTPLPEHARLAAGDAFIAAREAVETAKRQDPPVAVRVGEAAAVADVDAFLRLLLAQRARRSAEGWAAVDLVESGLTQRQAAALLRITPQAVSARLIAAGHTLDRDARPALVRLIAAADAAAS